MKRLFPFFLVVLSFLLAGSMSSAEECPEIVIAPDEPIAGVSDLFWGTNFLFWIEDDASLSDGKIEAAMKDLPIRLLRYPGGTVADNFHWKTNLLDNHFMFPYEEGPDESDFDEFMSFCSKVGAEPMLVVNTQSWALKDDIEGGAEEAAEWVRYCKEKGYHVDPEIFMAYYDSKGWVVGKGPMKSWTRAVAYWEHLDKKRAAEAKERQRRYRQHSYGTKTDSYRTNGQGQTSSSAPVRKYHYE